MSHCGFICVLHLHLLELSCNNELDLNVKEEAEGKDLNLCLGWSLEKTTV